MKIIAGLGYDDRLPNRPIEQLGCQYCGEQGLISALAFRAGIITPDVSQAARTVSYLNALKAVNNGNSFYSQSLEIDPIASAEALLKRRDWAISHGWTLDSRSKNLGRMAELATAEAHFTKSGTTYGERIYLLLPRLEIVASSVAVIELHHMRADWPPLYQYLFEELEKANVRIVEAPIDIQPQASIDTDLGKLQRALFSEEKGPIDLRQDGTLRLFSTSNGQLAAQYAIQAAKPESLIIASNHQHCLETVIIQLNGNKNSLGDLSASRAPNQLLLLTLQCAWYTPSANAVLQYLSLPAGRFQRLRRLLSKTFRDLPGFDRVRWQQQIDEFVAKELAEQTDGDEQKLRDSINEWLPIGMCDNDNIMPISLAITLTDRVAKYWQFLFSTPDQEEPSRAVFTAAFAAADAVSQALRDWPEETISKIQLNRLLTMVTNTGNSRYRDTREVSAFDVISRAEVAPLRATPLNHTLWIDPAISFLDDMPPLSKEELAGIPFAPDSTQQAQLKQQALKRAYAPLLAAQQSLTLILTDTAPELLQLQLSTLIDSNAWLPLEDAILSNQGVDATIQTVAEYPLPQAQRWWTIGNPVPGLHRTESYSSLASLAIKPHEYALKYAAQLNEGAIESLAADARLKGNLAHHLVEAWLTEHSWTGQPIDRSDINAWLDDILPKVIRQIALPLAQPGMQVEQLQFHQQMLEALDALLQALNAANVTNLHTEKHFEYDSTLGQLIGSIDIFCELNDGRFAIIDMKWGGYNKYREELKAGRPLQLATYAHIAQGKQLGQFADAGYFILNRAELLCNHNQVFPTATIIQPDVPTTLNQTWQKFENTLRWRMKQFDDGRIEQTYGNAAPDSDSQPPSDALDLLTLESSELKNKSNSYKTTFKAIDAWRNLTGNIKEH